MKRAVGPCSNDATYNCLEAAADGEKLWDACSPHSCKLSCKQTMHSLMMLRVLSYLYDSRIS